MAERANNRPETFVPEAFRRKGLWVAGSTAGLMIVYYLAFIAGLVDASPRDLGLSSLLLFSLVCFLFFATPWNDLGRVLRRFGPVEFERKLEGQSRERIRELAALEERISALENAQAPVTTDTSGPAEDAELRDQLVAFCQAHDQQAFTPAELASRAARQGYDALAGDSQKLRQALRHLVAIDALETRVSEDGQTLYRIRPG